MTVFRDYFDDVAIINLKSRPDRRKSIVAEMDRLGFAENSLRFPDPPMFEDNGGFPSKGVYGNYISHLSILREAQQRGVQRVLVLEDDAIFSHAARDIKMQSQFIKQAEGHDWAMWHLGHKLRSELQGQPKGVIPNKMEFHWAHCYAVQRDSLPELIAFLELLMSRPSGHHDGGKMYIDGALYHYRAEHTQKPCLVSHPPLSIQKGSDSNLAGPEQPGSTSWRKMPRKLARTCRDEFWRRTGVDFR